MIWRRPVLYRLFISPVDTGDIPRHRPAKFDDYTTISSTIHIFPFFSTKLIPQ